MEREIKREEDQTTEEEQSEDFFVTRANIICFSGLKPGEEHITLNVQRQNDPDLFYRIGKNMKLGLLMKDCCDRKGIVAGRFTFDGERVFANQAPEELEMEDGNVIDVWTERWLEY